jgi:hypothetical protein
MQTFDVLRISVLGGSFARSGQEELCPGQRVDQPSRLPHQRASERFRAVRGTGRHPPFRGPILKDQQLSNLCHGPILGRWWKYGVQRCGATVYGKTQDDIGERVDFAADLGIDTLIFDCEANCPDFVSMFLPSAMQVFYNLRAVCYKSVGQNLT